MAESRRMLWPIPEKDSEPWDVVFNQMVAAMDSSASASREDRNIIFTGGGLFSFDASSDTLSWDDTIRIVSGLTGFRHDIAAGSIAVSDGEFAYMDLIRGATGNISGTMLSTDKVSNTNEAYVVAARIGTSVYFRTGNVIVDGQTKSIFSGEIGAPGETVIASLSIASRGTNDSDTPLSVGAISFDPTEYDRQGLTQSIIFRALASNGDAGLTTHVKLVNTTDAEDVVTLDFTSTALTKAEATLTRGSGVGEIDDTEHTYEVHIYLDAPGVPPDSIELYSVEIRSINTVD